MKREINVPVSCGNLTVHPGDLVLGDCDGIVIVPQDRLSETLKKARQILEKEEQIQAEVERGKTIFDMLGLNRFFESQ